MVGSKGLKCTDTDSTAQTQAHLTKTFSPGISGGIYIRFYVYLPSAYFSDNPIVSADRRLLRVTTGIWTAPKGYISLRGGGIPVMYDSIRFSAPTPLPAAAFRRHLALHRDVLGLRRRRARTCNTGSMARAAGTIASTSPPVTPASMTWSNSAACLWAAAARTARCSIRIWTSSSCPIPIMGRCRTQRRPAPARGARRNGHRHFHHPYTSTDLSANWDASHRRRQRHQRLPIRHWHHGRRHATCELDHAGQRHHGDANRLVADQMADLFLQRASR